MVAFSIAASLLIIFLIVDRIQNIYNRRNQAQLDEERTKLEVLKIVAKDELHLMGEPDSVYRWVARLLKMMGYTEVVEKELMEDSAYDYTCTSGERTIYIACKLWNIKEFDAPVRRSAVQRLVGAMVGDRVKKGMIITTGTLTDEAASYLKSLPVSYKIEILDGTKLMGKLHGMRQDHLRPLLET